MTVIFQCFLCVCVCVCGARKRKFKVIFHEWLITIWLLKIPDEPKMSETDDRRRARVYTVQLETSHVFIFFFILRNNNRTDLQKNGSVCIHRRHSTASIQSCASHFVSSFFCIRSARNFFPSAKSTARKLIYCSWCAQWAQFMCPNEHGIIIAKCFGWHSNSDHYYYDFMNWIVTSTWIT